MRPNPTPSFPEREGPNHRSTQIVLRDSGAFLPLVAHHQNLMAETVRLDIRDRALTAARLRCAAEFLRLESPAQRNDRIRSEATTS
jgi:hypothetical protein